MHGKAAERLSSGDKPCLKIPLVFDSRQRHIFSVYDGKKTLQEVFVGLIGHRPGAGLDHLPKRRARNRAASQQTQPSGCGSGYPGPICSLRGNREFLHRRLAVAGAGSFLPGRLSRLSGRERDLEHEHGLWLTTALLLLPSSPIPSA